MKYKWISHDDLPALVLCLNQPKEPKVPTRRREFVGLKHQTGGLACHQHKFVATILTPTPDCLTWMRELSSEWLSSNVGFLGPPNLREVMRYRRHVRRIGADCVNAYHMLEEALYPLDCDPQCLRRLCVDDIPDELDDLLEFDSNIQRLMGCMTRWSTFVLGENCD